MGGETAIEQFTRAKRPNHHMSLRAKIESELFNLKSEQDLVVEKEFKAKMM